MDERGITLLRQLISDMEGAPYPGVVDGELYTIWYEHAQSVAQEALEYLNTEHPDDYAKDSALENLDF
ncbi:MAG TPA: hypothetical protein VMV90_10085 [Rectinemataceae bacterium]|nr:hypothetical protein [Rectinemataceae bacterium]